jgi:hypothetical protein
MHDAFHTQAAQKTIPACKPAGPAAGYPSLPVAASRGNNPAVNLLFVENPGVNATAVVAPGPDPPGIDPGNAVHYRKTELLRRKKDHIPGLRFSFTCIGCYFEEVLFM